MNFKKILTFLVAFALVIAGATLYLKLINKKREEIKPSPKVEVPAPLPPKKIEEEKPPQGLETKKLPKLAIIIDDIGHSKELGEEVLALKDVSIAIIPDLKYSLYFAERGRELGKDILIHVPMEPKSKDKYSDDTKMLKEDMSDEEIKSLAEKFIKSVPYAKGVNNHMGSKFTEDREKIKAFLDVVKDRGMFFLDSRTSPNSIAYDCGKELGLKTFKRDVFLDHELSEDKISRQLDLAIEEAKKKGYAIAIGHPHPETIKVLKRRFPEISRVVKIVPLTDLPTTE